MNGNKTEIAQSFLHSQCYKDRQMIDPGIKIALKAVEKMICLCMRQSDGYDCTCDKCYEITLLLKGLREAQGKVSADFYKCSACNSDYVWRTSLGSKSTLRTGVLVCGRKNVAEGHEASL